MLQTATDVRHRLDKDEKIAGGVGASTDLADGYVNLWLSTTGLDLDLKGTLRAHGPQLHAMLEYMTAALGRALRRRFLDDWDRARAEHIVRLCQQLPVETELEVDRRIEARVL